RWPDVPSSYILMTDDRAISRDWAQRMASDTARARIHTMPGGHSPFFARPKELCDLLIACCDDGERHGGG
ncbi:MAG: alpha/beta hydrolase, partial [Mycobacteriaceae bacterium]|nr:alpha/beta hydrolase [Mycobacteriaceae bacterium]